MGANLSVLSFPKMKRRRVSRQELLEEQKLYAYLDGKHLAIKLIVEGDNPRRWLSFPWRMLANKWKYDESIFSQGC